MFKGTSSSTFLGIYIGLGVAQGIKKKFNKNKSEILNNFSIRSHHWNGSNCHWNVGMLINYFKLFF